jgi:hypothetical protein
MMATSSEPTTQAVPMPPLGDSPPTSNGKGPATKADGGANRGPRRANSRPKKRRP